MAKPAETSQTISLFLSYVISNTGPVLGQLI